MNDAMKAGGLGVVSLTFRGRPFLRLNWPESFGPPGVVTVAKTIGNRYRVEDVFAAGQFSLLLAAFDETTLRPVMIKALRSDYLRASLLDPAELLDEVRRLRHLLQTERRLLVRLRNAGCNGVPCPNAYLYDVNPALGEAGLGLVDDLVETEPYLVLQRLVGVSLDELLATHHPHGMDERLALRIILPVVRILERLHEPWRLRNGRTWHCIYQDLKPANIVIEPLGRPTLLDFGGCQVVIDGTPVLEGSCTMGYAPPECEGPARVLLPCADVYGIGSTLYHMLTGVDPRDVVPERSGPPLDLRALSTRCSPGVRELLKRCLARKPSERLADARQVAERIVSLIA